MTTKAVDAENTIQCKIKVSNLHKNKMIVISKLRKGGGHEATNYSTQNTCWKLVTMWFLHSTIRTEDDTQPSHESCPQEDICQTCKNLLLLWIL